MLGNGKKLQTGNIALTLTYDVCSLKLSRRSRISSEKNELETILLYPNSLALLEVR